jgi:glutathione synthase/RimK-type ligase-like ATP-grasp enzyme
MPKPDLESHLLLEILERRGVSARLVPWDSAYDWAATDVVVIRSPWDYFERLDEFLEWTQRVESITRLANPSTVVRWNTHKGYLLDLAAADVAIVPTRLVPQGTIDVPTELLPDGEIVVKPAVSVGAIGALRSRSDDPRAAAHIIDLARNGDVLVQPFIPSVLDSGETSLMFAGGRLSHAVRKVPAPGDYRVQDHHGGTVEPHRATPDEIALAEAALAVARAGGSRVHRPGPGRHGTRTGRARSVPGCRPTSSRELRRRIPVADRRRCLNRLSRASGR